MKRYFLSTEYGLEIADIEDIKWLTGGQESLCIFVLFEFLVEEMLSSCVNEGTECTARFSSTDGQFEVLWQTILCL